MSNRTKSNGITAICLVTMFLSLVLFIALLKRGIDRESRIKCIKNSDSKATCQITQKGFWKTSSKSLPLKSISVESEDPTSYLYLKSDNANSHEIILFKHYSNYFQANQLDHDVEKIDTFLKNDKSESLEIIESNNLLMDYIYGLGNYIILIFYFFVLSILIAPFGYMHDKIKSKKTIEK